MYLDLTESWEALGITDERVNAFLAHLREKKSASADELARLLDTDPDGVWQTATRAISRGNPVVMCQYDAPDSAPELVAGNFGPRHRLEYYLTDSSAEITESRLTIINDIQFLSDQLQGLDGVVLD